MRSVFAIRRDTPVDSKVFYHHVCALTQCAQIIDRYKFFLLTIRAPQINLDYNLGQNRMEQQTPIPQIKISQGRNRAKAHPWRGRGRGVAAAYTQSSVTSYINETASHQ